MSDNVVLNILAILWSLSRHVSMLGKIFKAFFNRVMVMWSLCNSVLVPRMSDNAISTVLAVFWSNCEGLNAWTQTERGACYRTEVSYRKLWCKKLQSMVASQQLLSAAVQPCSIGPAAYFWKSFRCSDAFPLVPVNHFALTVNIAKWNSQLLAMQTSFSDFTRPQYITTYMPVK